MYLLTEQQIRDLYNKNIKPEDVLLKNNIALFTWSGQDVLNKMLSKEININFIDLEGFICLVKDYLEDCQCWLCFDAVFDDVLTKFLVSRN